MGGCSTQQMNERSSTILTSCLLQFPTSFKTHCMSFALDQTGDNANTIEKLSLPWDYCNTRKSQQNESLNDIMHK